ncbi:pancreatic triacylglycerol lipase-like [Ostrinia nubilalis]|uniref:pancreatic triacylglycerol lipase-like n=1 Tax=Ostrinia nubilalis TaxID=29057 RepID=UPI0030823DFC
MKTEQDIEFRLYSMKDPDNYIVLDESAMLTDDAMGVLFNNAPLKVITHGWMSNADKSAVMNIKNSYFIARTNVNVIAVDWSGYSMNYYYMSAASQTKAVGRKIAQFLNSMHRRFNISGDQMHLIGHSLGAHVMGIAGYESEIKIGRVTGLDPALPMFENIQNQKTRLDYADAKFVDVIHTCGGVLGFWDAIGQADFYPNNGKAPQPGCNIQNIFHWDACSHGRAHIYFAESIINPKAFPAYRCNNWRSDLEKACPHVGFMGEAADWNMRGIFYLSTNSEEPFGRGIRS